MRWGAFDIFALESGHARYDGGAIFGVVPRTLWEPLAPPDAQHRVELAHRLLLVVDPRNTPVRRVLIDTGLGDKMSARQRERLGFTPPADGWSGLLAQAGCGPDEITDVILTHLHFDHAGGATVRRADGTLEPAFARATYHLQRRALKWAEHAPEKDRRSYEADDYRVLSGRGQLHLLDGPTELFEGIELLVSEGHTVGLQLPLIDGGEAGRMLFCGDIIPTRHHIRLPWIMAYDLYPLTTLEEKRLLLAQGLQEGWTMFFEHDPQVAACRLDEREGVVVEGEAVAVR